jgi:hypothetical protein
LKRFLLFLSFVAVAGVASAGPVMDGILTPDEYGAGPIKHFSPFVNGANPTGGVQSVDVYWWIDAWNVYGAVVGDPSSPHLPQANIYVYSTNSSRDLAGNPGAYGDGDDVIIEGLNRWSLSLNDAPWATTPQTFAVTPLGGGRQLGEAGGIVVAFNPATLVQEFLIPRSIVGDYSVYRYGGQLYAYEFNTGTASREPGALAPGIPEPGTWLLLMSGVVAVMVSRRLR